MKRLSIGIVGAGEITRRAHLPVLTNTPNVQIAWLYDHRPESVLTLARAYRLEALHSLAPEALPACDIALLAIPVDARGDYLRHFSRQGTAVFCEKPFAMSAAEHLLLAEQFAPHALGCGFMRRFFRSTMLLRRIVAEGIFGSLLRMDISEGNRSKGSGVDSSFLDDPRLGASRGVLADLGSHTIDMALYVSGASAFEVRSHTLVLDGAVDRKVTAQVTLQGASSSPSRSIELNYGASWLDRQDNRIRLIFPHAIVWSDLSVSADVYVGSPENPRDNLLLTSEDVGARTYNQAFFLEWRNFLEGFRAQRESLVSARSALLTTSLVESLLNTETALPN